MNMAHDMDKDVHKIYYVQESNHTCTARTHARVCGSWAAEAISYSLKILREHPQFLTKANFCLICFSMHLLYSVAISIVPLYSIFFVSCLRASLSSSIQEVILPGYGLGILWTVETIFQRR